MPSEPQFKTLFSPLNIGALTVKNRVVMAPMVTEMASDTGAATPVLISYLAERAKGGVGLIIVEACYVDSPGITFSCHLGIDRDSLVPSHAELTEAVHRYGAKVALQIHHGGNKANPDLNGGRVLAPSVLPTDGLDTHEMTVDEIATAIRRFGEAAERAQRAGYDAVEIHGAHGYLVHQFLSRASNLRTDDYGGDTAARLKFSLEVIGSVRDAVGPSFPVIFRLSAAGGYDIEEAVTFAGEWEAAEVDALHVSEGGTAPTETLPEDMSPMAIPQGYLVDYAEAIKNRVDIPVIAVGEIRDPEFAEEALNTGKTDFIALARQLLSDPDWAGKAETGEAEDILKCVACDLCHTRLSLGTPVRCLVNPRVGRETWLGEPEPALTTKKVMVVGSGPAGMETARVAALRGHRVTLYETEDQLGGGQFELAIVPPFKGKLTGLREHMARELAKTPAEVHLGSHVDAGTVRNEAPDVLVVATGAVPLIPEIPGLGGDNVVTAYELLNWDSPPQGKSLAILGGRQVGCETAEHLASNGNAVTVIARSPASELASDAPASYREALIARLRKSGVTFLTQHNVKDVLQGGLTVSSAEDGERFLAVDLVVIARGAVPSRALADQVGDMVPEVHVIGDSVEPRTIAEAIYEGTLVGREL